MGKPRGVAAHAVLLLLCAAATAQPAAQAARAALEHAPQRRVRAEQAALQDVLHGTGASGVVLDWISGAVLAQVGAPPPSLPGSAVKPLLLAWALQEGMVAAGTQAFCRRTLRVGGRALPCTHPPDQQVFTAETALAESCNTWFAQMGERMSPVQMGAALRGTGLPYLSPEETTTTQRQLTALGLRGVRATPLQLAEAYRALLLRQPREGAVWRGLAASVAYGMANPAQVDGLTLLGKTGTASDPGQVGTHGWFAGALPGGSVVVVFVPRGDGGVAARLAGRVFARVRR